MSEHVLEWINAYHDGELRGELRRDVEAHLATCAACQAELEALQSLSLHLQAAPPMPARTPPEQFVAGVRLRLPPRAEASARHRVRLAAGLWLPLSVLGLWALGQAVLLVGGLAFALALVPGVLPPLPLLDALTEPAGLGGWALWLTLNAGLTAAAGLLAWGCLAAWWAAREQNVTVPNGLLN